MSTDFIRHSRINRLSAFALISLCFFQTQARTVQAGASSFGQNEGEVVLLFSSLPAGIARGQTLRASLGFEQDRNAAVELRATAQLLDAHGCVIAQSAEVEIPPGGVRTIDFNGDALPQSGGVGQHEICGAMIKINYIDQTGSGSGQTRGRIIVNDIWVSLELFDNLTGETQVKELARHY